MCNWRAISYNSGHGASLFNDDPVIDYSGSKATTEENSQSSGLKVEHYLFAEKGQLGASQTINNEDGGYKKLTVFVDADGGFDRGVQVTREVGKTSDIKTFNTIQAFQDATGILDPLKIMNSVIENDTNPALHPIIPEEKPTIENLIDAAETGHMQKLKETLSGMKPSGQ